MAEAASSKSDNKGEAPFMIKNYNVGKTIGQGTYGKVKLAQDTRTGLKVC